MPDAPNAARRTQVPLLSRALVYVSLTTVALAQPLLQTYGDNLAVFTSAHYSGWIVVWFAGFVLVVPPFVLLLLDVALSTVMRGCAGAVHVVLVLLGSWWVTALLLRDITTGLWPVDALLSLAAAVAVTLAYVRRREVRSWLSWLSPLSIVVAGMFVQSTMSVINPPDAAPAGDRAQSATATSSVVWIALDEAPLFPLVGTDGTINKKRFPGFAALASGSTWYRNAVATSQKTTDAVPAMLEGKWPGNGSQPTLGDHPRNVFTALGGAMKMDVSESVTAMCPPSVCTAGAGNAGPDDAAPQGSTSPVPFASFLRDASIVMGHKLLPAGLRDRLPPIDEGWGEFGAGSEQDGAAVGTGAGSTVPVRSGHAGRIGTIRRLIANASSSTSPTLHFAHVLLPHKPWTLAPDLRMSARPDNDPRPVSSLDRRRDAYQSHLRQFVAVDSVIGEMVASLRASGRWDDTTVVVTADHGLTFVPGESYRDVVNVGNPQTLDDIYRIPLFVKFPGQVTGQVNDCPASSVDILPTVLAATGVPTDWVFDGVDLAGQCPSRPSRTIRWPEGEHDLATGVDALFSRVAYYDKWVVADGDADDIVKAGLSGVLVGTRAPQNPTVDPAFTWKLANAAAFGSVTDGEFGSVPTRAFGTVSSVVRVSRSTEGLVEVDGTFVGVVSEIAGLGKGSSTYFSAPLQTSLLRPGPHTVRLWTASWQNGTASLRLVGNPA